MCISAKPVYAFSVYVTLLVAMGAKKKFDTDKMRREFMSSTITLRELAKRHECSYRHVSGMSAKERWYPQRRALQQQAELVATDALMKRVSARCRELAELKVVDAQQHVQRSLQIGEGLHALLLKALAAVDDGDTRELQAAIRCWREWDEGVRKNHRIDQEPLDQPVVNIAVLSALPDKPKLQQKEATAAPA